MRRIIYIILIVGFTQMLWGVPPKIAQPQEQSIITKEKLFIFIEPTPEDVEERRYIQIEIYERELGQRVLNLVLTPDQNYKDSIDVSSWKNGKYLLKVVYTDKRGKHLTKSSWRNFNVER